MCAISGYVTAGLFDSTDLIAEMNDLQKHRGPDDEGYFLLNKSNEALYGSGDNSTPVFQKKYPSIHKSYFPHFLGLAHRRYSVQDLSPNGHQPFIYKDKTMVFHGEIFNFQELKNELIAKGYDFFTNTDAEPLLIAFHHWGTEAFGRLNGLFSLAIYDHSAQTLTLARDHIGKAPLYYTQNEETIYFATEIKPLLRANKSIRKKINPIAVGDYLRYGIRDFDNHTFWTDVQSLPPGSYAVYDVKLNQLKINTYWRLPTVRRSPSDYGFEEATNHFAALLQDALVIRTKSDLNIGFLLSGGLDSSALAGYYAHTQSNPGKKAPCYTVRFDNPVFNEENYALKVYNKYPDFLEPNMVNGFQDTLTDDLDYFFDLCEEPFHSPDLYTAHVLLKLLKRQGVGVNICGTGGDELLAGYESEYMMVFMKFLLENYPADYIKQFVSQLFYHPKWRRKASVMYQNILLLTRMKGRKIDNLAHEFITIIPRKLALSANFNERMVENFSDFKMNYWLLSDNKQSFGLPSEPRTPFLDVRLIDFAFQLPPQYLIHNGWHKYILRKAVEPILPPEVVWRKNKMGFPFDLPQWLATSKNILVAPLAGKLIPYIDAGKVVRNYDRLVQLQPLTLWRMICYCLWYIKIVEETSLENKRRA